MTGTGHVRRRTAGIAATTALVGAAVVGLTGPAQAANAAGRTAPLRTISGKWIYDYKSPHATKHIQSYGKVRMCFNVKGTHLYQGYRLMLMQRIGGVLPHDKEMWAKNFWGAKHKTCTPWKSAGHDKVWAWITPVKEPTSKARAQIWLYNP